MPGARSQHHKEPDGNNEGDYISVLRLPVYWRIWEKEVRRRWGHEINALQLTYLLICLTVVYGSNFLGRPYCGSGTSEGVINNEYMTK